MDWLEAYNQRTEPRRVALIEAKRVLDRSTRKQLRTLMVSSIGKWIDADRLIEIT